MQQDQLNHLLIFLLFEYLLSEHQSSVIVNICHNEMSLHLSSDCGIPNQSNRSPGPVATNGHPLSKMCLFLPDMGLSSFLYGVHSHLAHMGAGDCLEF
jgi:hypothetical protein